MANDFIGLTHKFTAPSSHVYEIREQNGEDDDILSNLNDLRTMANFTKFIMAIVVDTSFTSNGRLTFEQAESLPLLDRYCILFESRRFSIGNQVEFEYTWPGLQTLTYSQDLNEMLFSNYGEFPSDQELEEKPYAIPYYPNGKKLKDISFTLTSGKEIIFDVMDGKAESWIATLPESKRSRNIDLLAHNIRLKVDDHWEKVDNFRPFSVKDMMEIRKTISSWDPEFTGTTPVTNPTTGEQDMFPLISASDFFFPTER